MGFALRSGNGTLVLVALLSLLALTIDTTWQVVDVVACFVVFKGFFYYYYYCYYFSSLVHT